jgi:hypothetical protein
MLEPKDQRHVASRETTRPYPDDSVPSAWRMPMTAHPLHLIATAPSSIAEDDRALGAAPILSAKNLRQAVQLLHKTVHHPLAVRARGRGDLHTVFELGATVARLIALHRPELRRQRIVRLLVVASTTAEILNDDTRVALNAIADWLGTPELTIEVEWLVDASARKDSDPGGWPLLCGDRCGNHRRIDPRQLATTPGRYDAMVLVFAPEVGMPMAQFDLLAPHLSPDIPLFALSDMIAPANELLREIGTNATGRWGEVSINPFSKPDAKHDNPREVGRWRRHLVFAGDTIVQPSPARWIEGVKRLCNPLLRLPGLPITELLEASANLQATRAVLVPGIVLDLHSGEICLEPEDGGPRFALGIRVSDAWRADLTDPDWPISHRFFAFVHLSFEAAKIIPSLLVKPGSEEFEEVLASDYLAEQTDHAMGAWEQLKLTTLNRFRYHLGQLIDRRWPNERLFEAVTQRDVWAAIEALCTGANPNAPRAGLLDSLREVAQVICPEIEQQLIAAGAIDVTPMDEAYRTQRADELRVIATHISPFVATRLAGDWSPVHRQDALTKMELGRLAEGLRSAFGFHTDPPEGRPGVQEPIDYLPTAVTALPIWRSEGSEPDPLLGPARELPENPNETEAANNRWWLECRAHVGSVPHHRHTTPKRDEQGDFADPALYAIAKGYVAPVSPPEPLASADPTTDTIEASPVSVVTDEATTRGTPAEQGTPGTSTPETQIAATATAAPTGFAIQIQTVVAVGHRVREQPIADTARQVRTAIVQWVRSHGRELPPDADEREQLEVEDVAFTLSIDAAVDMTCWTLRYEHADSDHPGRRWRTEAVLLMQEGLLTLGFRLVVLDPHRIDAPPMRTVPRILRQLAAEVGLSDGGVPLTEQLHDATPGSIEAEFQWIDAERRSRPVVITTLPAHGQRGLNATRIAQSLGPTARVVSLDARMASWYRRRVGKDAGLGPGLARVFPAGLGLEAGNRRAIDVRLERPADIQALLHAALEPVVARRLQHDDFPSLLQVRQWLYDHRVRTLAEGGADNTARLQMIETRAGDLATQVTELTELLQIAESERDAAIEREQDTADLVRTLRAQIYHLNQRTPTTTEETRIEPDWPESFDDLETWVNTHLGGRLVIARKAASAARKSVFADVPFVYRCLWAMAEYYWPMRLQGDNDARARWLEFLKTHRLEFGPTGAALDNRLTRESYQVQYGQRRYPLDVHLQGSSSRKEEDCLRCYAHVHEEDQVVVIGWLPSHLPNSHS